MTMNSKGDIHWGEHNVWQWQGEDCHWRRIGDPNERALLLIHGFATGSGHWRNNIEDLAKGGWCVYAIDLIGFGDSSQPIVRLLDNRYWARQVEAFIRIVIQKRTILVGHSLGGLVALTCSVLFPDWIDGVVAAPLPDPTILMRKKHTANSIARKQLHKRKLKRVAVTILCNLLPLEILIPILVYSPLLDLAIQLAYSSIILGDTQLRHIVGRPARRPTAVGTLRSMSKGMALRPWRATAASLLERHNVPLYLIWGQNDLIVPMEVAWNCQKIRKDIVVTVIQGAGHCPHDERPERFNQIVLGWLQSCYSEGEN